MLGKASVIKTRNQVKEIPVHQGRVFCSSSTGIVQLITMIGERTCSLKEIMGMMELKNRENFLDNYLNPSIEVGLVEPLYPNQPKHPRQKYRLTEQGKALLQDREKKN